VSVTIGGSTEPPDVEYITTAQWLQEVLPELLAAPRLGLDTETTGLDPLTAQLRLVQLALPTRTILIDVFQVPLPLLTPVFTQPAITLLGHNLKFDLKFLVAAGFTLASGGRGYDAMGAAARCCRPTSTQRVLQPRQRGGPGAWVAAR